LVMAPGNFVRYEAQSAGLSLNERFNGLIELIWQHFSQDLPVIYLFIVLLSILSLQQLKVQHLRLWLWLIIAIMFSFSMAGSTGINFQYRTAFVTEIVVIIGLTTLLFPLWLQAKKSLVVVLPASSVLLLIWSMDFITVYEQYYATFQQEQRRIELRSAYTQNKIKKIYLPSMKIPSIAGLKDDVHEGRYFLRDLHGDKKDNEWRNGSYANYHGFEFAWRVKQPYLIFLPELLTNPAWKIHKNEAQMMLFSRIEQVGYQSLRALYLISPKTSCIKQFSVQAEHKPSKKSGDKSGKKNKTQNSIAEVAIVNSSGFIDKSYCTSRLELKHNSKPLRLKSSGFNNLSLDVNSSLNLKQLPTYMLTKVNPIKTWQACRLPRQAKTISTAFFCTATNTPNMPKGIMTYGPYHPIAPGQYQASIQYQAQGNAGTWDQVIQYDGRSQHISQQPLPDTEGKIVTLNYNFRVTKPHGKLEIRSYYNGMGKLTLYSIKLSSLK